MAIEYLPEMDEEPIEELVIHDLEAIKIVYHPLRIRIMRALTNKARSVNQLAEELNVPFTRLYYHIQLMEKHEIIKLVNKRLFSGAVEEKYYRISAYDIRTSLSLRKVDGKINEEWLNRSVLALLDDTRKDLHHSVQAGLINNEHRPPHPHALNMTRSFLQLAPQDVSELHNRLQVLMREFQERQNETSDPWYAFLNVLYPTNFPMQDDNSVENEPEDSSV